MGELPVVAITIGDPAGVGPEVVAAALAGGDVAAMCRPVVIGDRGVLERAARTMGVSLKMRSVSGPG
ncbi:MAG: 4-hydroxythreonine-4-phosphate dehydrogenase PdxA, partial [Dehalococcoidia bacterium]